MNILIGKNLAKCKAYTSNLQTNCSVNIKKLVFPSISSTYYLNEAYTNLNDKSVSVGSLAGGTTLYLKGMFNKN